MTFFNTNTASATFFLIIFTSQINLTMENKNNNTISNQDIAQAMTNLIMTKIYEQNNIDPTGVAEVQTSTEAQAQVNELLAQKFQDKHGISIEEFLRSKKIKKTKK